MVSFWPFRTREDSSPDTFERTLSQLASKIQTRNAKIAFLRQRLRKIKAVWTLYSIFAWILFVFGLFFLRGFGWEDLKWVHYVEIGGSPVVIYGVRKAFDFVFEYQINSAENSLADLKVQQRETIEKLKEATKFYSTQSILEKYGDVKPEADKKKPKAKGPATPQRPAAGAPAPGQPTPDQLRQQQIQKQLAASAAISGPRSAPGEKIPTSTPAPGAIALPPQLAALQNQPPPLITEVASEPHWYDRILDVLVGEDETSAKARYALICKNCRMVNGLAPPGTRSLEEVGGWGCARCGVMNGKVKEVGHEEEKSEGEEVRRKAKKKRTPRPKTPEETTDDNGGLTPGSESESGEEEEAEVVDIPEVKEEEKARRRKGGKKKA